MFTNSVAVISGHWYRYGMIKQKNENKMKQVNTISQQKPST